MRGSRRRQDDLSDSSLLIAGSSPALALVEAEDTAEAVLRDIDAKTKEQNTGLGKTVRGVTSLFTGDTSKKKDEILRRVKKDLHHCLFEIKRSRGDCCGKMFGGGGTERKLFQKVLHIICRGAKDYSKVESSKNLTASPFSVQLSAHARRLESIEAQLRGNGGSCVIL